MFVLEHTETLVLFITIRDKTDIFRLRQNGMLILPEARPLPLETFHDCAHRIKEKYLIDKKLRKPNRFTIIHETCPHGKHSTFSSVYVQDFDDECVIKDLDQGEWTPYRAIFDDHECPPLTHEVLTLLSREHRLI